MAHKTKTLILPIILIGLFLFTRFYKINSSLFFFNDMGRDAYTLLNWLRSGKPPLLGPQTSALPINQSAIYFYMLYPLFLLTHQSPLFALYTNAIVYIFSFLFCLHLTKHSSKLQKSLLLIFFLIIIHPQYIIQNRYIWNPSFVTPFLLICLTSFSLLHHKVTNKLLVLFTLSLSMALSLSYSIAPVAIALILYSFFKFKQHFIKILLYLCLGLFLTNIGTVAFEIRHGFLLTKTLFDRGVTNQQGISLLVKITDLISHTTSISHQSLAIIIFTSFFFLKKSVNKKIFILSVLLYILAPIKPQAHYIFGLTTLVFFIVSTQTKFIKLIYLALFLILYINPKTISSYFKPAPRTYQQMSSCYQKFCRNHTQALFVSVNSIYHPYHFGPEHRYLLAKNGCNVIDIENYPDQANHMAVISDGGTYQHNQTKYHELTMFGKSEEIETFTCQPNLSIHLLKKIN